ncbi:hypothetical protein UNH65_19560 [Chitinophaga sp. 180180018-2]
MALMKTALLNYLLTPFLRQRIKRHGKTPVGVVPPRSVQLFGGTTLVAGFTFLVDHLYPFHSLSATGSKRTSKPNTPVSKSNKL